ncbi:hypothetical protein Bca101_012237 [Brassica carinata]
MKNLHFLIVFLLSISSSIDYVVVTSLHVKYLPGFEGPLPFALETGYVGVGESEDVKLFYYFVKSERNPKKDPLMIWLTGGPGCSSLSALLFANGPLAFKKDEYNGKLPPLELASFSWTKVANILYLESPVGAGYSYAKTPLASEASDTKQFLQIDQFLRRWLVEHPEFISSPFYVGGDSYAGHIVPGVVQQISLGLMGYVLGNPLTNRTIETNHKVSFAHGMGLISEDLVESLEKSCGGNYMNVDPKQILLPNCPVDYIVPKINAGGRRELEEVSGNGTPSLPPLTCFTYSQFLFSFWANDENVRRALGVKKGGGHTCAYNPDQCSLMFSRWIGGEPLSSPLAFKGDEYNGTVPPLELTSFSWTKVANILYLESPAGSGYSYAKTPRASEASDAKQIHQIDQFLRKWLVEHPEFISNPFYVGGDSYSGNIVPGVVQQISLVDYVLPNTTQTLPNIKTSGRRELKEISGNDTPSLPPPSCFTYRYFLSAIWANDENVRRALGVKMGGGHTAEYNPDQCSLMFKKWIDGEPL